MMDSAGRKSSEVGYESDEDDTTALQWTARRMEASDDDGDDEVREEDDVKETYRRSAIGLSSDSDESKGLDGAPDYYDELEEAGRGGESDDVSQEQGDLRDIGAVNQGREKVESEEVFVPTSGWFYMHDDRIEWKDHGRPKGIISRVKLLDCTDKQKWRHDKFEEMTLQETLNKSFMHLCLKFCYILYKVILHFLIFHCLCLLNCKCDNHTLKIFQDISHQQQSKDLGKGHRCVRANQCESHGHFWSQQQGKNRSNGYTNVKTNYYESYDNFGCHQQQRNNGNKGQDTNYFGNQNITSRTVKGRGPVRYKLLMKGKRLGTLSKHQQPAKLQERTPCSGFPRVSSHTSSFCPDSPVPRIEQFSSNAYSSLPLSDSMSSSIHGTFKTQRINEKLGRIDKCTPTSIEKDDKHSALERKIASKEAGSKASDYKDSFQHNDGDLPCGSCPIYNNVHMLSLLLLRPVPEQWPITSRILIHWPLFNNQASHPGNGYQSFPKSLSSSSSVEIPPQTSYFEFDFIGRGSRFLTGVMQPGDWPYGAVGRFSPSIALTGYPPSEQGSRTSEIISVGVAPTEPCNRNKSHNGKWAVEPVGDEFRQKWLQPRTRRYSEMSWDSRQNV